MDASEVGTFRNLERAGWRPGDMTAFFWGWNDRRYAMPRPVFELRQRLRRMYPLDPFRSGPEDMDRWVRTWRSIRPKMVLGYASTIARFAGRVERTGARIPAVAGVCTTAEKLYPEQRDLVQRVLGGRAFDCYGSREVQNIAAECHQGSMHVQADYVVVEAEPAPPGEPSPLLATSLWNRSMPFIRCRNEDTGLLRPDEDCKCGSGFPLMELRIARISDNFPLPNGRVVHGEFFTHLLYGSEGVDSFRIHQTALDHIELLIQPGPGDPGRRVESVRRALQEVAALDPSLTVEAREVETIHLSSAGKHRFTRSDLSGRGALAG